MLLYHHTLSGASRTVRLFLSEKRMSFDLAVKDPWTPDESLFALNPSGELPILVLDDDQVLSDANAICEYLEETESEPALIGRSPQGRAETRRLVNWFASKFQTEVTEMIAGEKLVKRLTGGAPDSRFVRAGKSNINTHLSYISWLSERRSWLAGDTLSWADLTAAAQLSLVDYTGDVPWGDHPLAKDWYARVKSRPSMRPLLSDTVQGVPPHADYANLDF